MRCCTKLPLELQCPNQIVNIKEFSLFNQSTDTKQKRHSTSSKTTIFSLFVYYFFFAMRDCIYINGKIQQISAPLLQTSLYLISLF